MGMKFSYFRFPREESSPLFGRAVLRPIIPITLSRGEHFIDYAALIDSGADFCIFDAEIGELLGIDVLSGDRIPFEGVQDSRPTEAFLHSVDFNIGKSKYTTTIGFSHDIAK